MKEEKSMTRQLPVFRMEETDFIVDVRLGELREADAPWNRISLDEIREEPDGTVGILYDKRTKNVFRGQADPENMPEYVRVIIFPSIIGLDPVGWARKYGLADDAFTRGDFPAFRERHKMAFQQSSSKRRKKGRGQ